MFVNSTVECFNRYMVECEFAVIDERIAAYNGFNRYMVECESGIC